MPGLAPAACQPAENERGLLRQNGSCQAALPILSAMSSERPESVLLTLDEVAAALGMSRKSVQRRIKAGVIRTVRIPRKAATYSNLIAATIPI
jgi:predicted DNA-binding transcriptional regulator AlpA